MSHRSSYSPYYPRRHLTQCESPGDVLWIPWHLLLVVTHPNKKGRHKDGGDAVRAAIVSASDAPQAQPHGFPKASPVLGASASLMKWMKEIHDSFESLQCHKCNLKRARDSVEYTRSPGSRLALVVGCNGIFSVHLEGKPTCVKHISQFPNWEERTSKDNLQVVMCAFGCLRPCDGIHPPFNMDTIIKWNDWESINDLMGAPCSIKVPGNPTMKARAKQSPTRRHPYIIGRKCGLIFHKHEDIVCCMRVLIVQNCRTNCRAATWNPPLNPLCLHHPTSWGVVPQDRAP